VSVVKSAPSRTRIWRWPAVIAATVCFGLLSALLGHGGVWQPLSWIALTVPLATIVGCLARVLRVRPEPVSLVTREAE
jgi:hypothetical protein